MNMASVKHIALDGKNVVRLAMDGDVVWEGLPAGYTLLEYIETTGTQYINTGFIPNQDSRIVCTFLYFGGSGIYGARTSTAANNFSLRVINSNWQPGYSILGSTDVAADTINWHTADQNKNEFFMDGALIKTFEYTAFRAPKPIILGGINANNAVYYGKCRYQNCRIYDDAQLVRDLVPCRNPAGEAGMWDKHNCVFYGNAGSDMLAGV